MLEYEKRGSAVTIHLTGELDQNAAARLKGQLDAVSDDPKVKRLIFDLSELRFMDSSGIGLLIGRYKLMQKRGGSVAVCSVDKRMDSILQMAGLYRIIEKLA